MKSPIAVMSFNRPDYLEETLISLAAQVGGGMEDREVHLFQDGAINSYSKIVYARAEDVDASINIFKTVFPNGQVHFRGENIGIAENFYRAENYMFSERGFDYVYFFEDDLVLSPVYLQMMQLLEEFSRSSGRVAYFSAYGDHYATADELSERRKELVGLDHHWAFGLNRVHWAKIRGALEGYYKIVRGQDYARRDHKAIYEYFATTGDTVPRGSSQDAAKAWACDRLQFWRCMTFVPFGRYIGTRGAHMTPEEYEAIGFGRTVVETTVISDLDFPDEAGVGVKLAEQRSLLRSIKDNELQGIMARLPAKEWNPMRRCTADDVRAAYRLLLHRDPESQEVIDRHVRETAVYSLVRGLTRSQEFTGLSGKIDHPW